MAVRQPATLLLCGLLLGCARDATITRGADGDSDWRRRAEAAVPVGTALETARATMETNGFHCQAPTSGAEALSCDKLSASRLGLVRRRWQAAFDAVDGRVTAVRTSTGLMGP